MVNLKHKPIIEGETVILRPFKMKEDFPFLEECLQDSEVIKLTGSTDDFDKQEVWDWYNTRNEQLDRLDLAIIDKTTENLVGEVVANLYDEAENSMNFRIMIGPRGRNRGLGTEATQLMVNYLFQHTDINFITLSVFAFNPRAKAVYEKVGFVFHSIDEKDLEYEGEWIDSINMKLTRDNWMKKIC
ncbi:GNAT family N-acetyltransferase [Ornithinibacillus bavariensis]|uniref:GNAT family N-acetyltransferase n=1 Tax=Ornithinibacillus bavariensis TaxID=545502 RepID=UPI000EE7CAF4|nr:N-acetyltransferase [Ornithinibacillus sp.]